MFQYIQFCVANKLSIGSVCIGGPVKRRTLHYFIAHDSLFLSAVVCVVVCMCRCIFAGVHAHGSLNL